MSGSMYDLSVITFSPEGRIYQVEYATKAVENSETACGVRCKDGVVLGCEKQFFSKLLIENSNRRIYNIETSIGMAICGKIPDGRAIVQRARSEASDYLKTFSIPIVGNILSDRMQIFVHQFTLYGGYRPYGAAALIASYDQFDGFNLHMVEPSGHCYGYHACAHGKGRQICKAEFEKKDFKNLTCVEALPFIAKMLILSHEEFKDKKFEYELSWITKDTNFQHQQVPLDLIKNAVEEAEKIIEQEQIGE